LLDFVRTKALEIGAIQVSQKEQMAYV